MIFMEPFWILMDVISGAAKKEDEKRGDPRYVRCLHCGALVVKSEVKRRGGCYVCGWVPGAETVRKDERVLKVKCPQCGRTVLKSELIKRGCYLCGWKPCLPNAMMLKMTRGERWYIVRSQGR